MKQLEEASQEIVSMDAMKKDIVYNLGHHLRANE